MASGDPTPESSSWPAWTQGKLNMNMGHKWARTTFEYIGTFDAADRQSHNAFSFDITGYLNS
jgi:hypothetical protein